MVVYSGSQIQTSGIIQYQPGSGSSEHTAEHVSDFRLYKVILIIFSSLLAIVVHIFCTKQTINNRNIIGLA